MNDIGDTEVTNGNPVMIYENGEFELGDDWKASFVDKFREGSYLQIKQSNGSALNHLFRTRWSIMQDAVYDTDTKSYVAGYIDDNYLALYPGQKSVVNDPNLLDNTITNVEGYTASDDRNVASVDGQGAVSYLYPANNRENHVSGKNDTIVFRGYFNPDNAQKSNVHLTVAYENELISGGIVITKVLDYDDDRVAEKDYTYTFHIHYRNVGGAGLESGLDVSSGDDDEGMVQTVQITVPKHEAQSGKEVSLVIYGIPLGTEYSIHEVNEEPEGLEIGNVYEYVKPVDKSFTDSWDENENKQIDSSYGHDVRIDKETYKVGTVDVEQQVFKGTVEESIQELRFTNKQYYPDTEIKIVKDLSGSVYAEDRTFLFHVHATWEEENQTQTRLINVYVEVKAGQSSGYALVQELPINAQYQVHEVDETYLMSVESENCTQIESDEPLTGGDTGKDHEKVHILENQITDDEECEVKYLATGITQNSRQPFIFTNRGPNSLTLIKTDLNDYPLINAGFTLYSEDGRIYETQQLSGYYWKRTANTNDLQISDNGNIYSVYTLRDEKAYYVPLTEEEITRYLNGELESNDIVALVHFDDLPDGNYYFRETFSPNGYSGLSKDTQIRFTLPYENKNEWTNDQHQMVTLDTLDEAVNVQYTINNQINTGIFQFYKENKEGMRMSGINFVLYRLICDDDSHDHSRDLIEIDENGDLENNYEYTDCWYKVRMTATNQNGFVSFSGLATDDTYRLIEVNTYEGYSLPTGQWIVTYDPLRQNFTVSASIDNPPAFSGQGTIADPYIVRNYKIGDLPSAGGRGWIYLIGAGLMIIVMIYWSYIGILRLRWKHQKLVSKEGKKK